MNADLEAAAVERVARQRYEHDERGSAPSNVDWDRFLSDAGREAYRDEARALLAAVLGTTVEVPCDCGAYADLPWCGAYKTLGIGEVVRDG